MRGERWGGGGGGGGERCVGEMRERDEGREMGGERWSSLLEKDFTNLEKLLWTLRMRSEFVKANPLF